MSLLISRHRRKILLTAVALVAGGYASYRLYKSPAVTRRRKQLLRLLMSLSLLGDAVSQSAESASIVSEDLKAFLVSDADEVPQSLRQAFKIGQCPEFKQSLVVFCTALTEGVLQGTNRNDGKLGKGDCMLLSPKPNDGKLGKGDCMLLSPKPGFEGMDASVAAGVLGSDNKRDQVRLRVERVRREVTDVRYIQNNSETGGSVSLEQRNLGQGAHCEESSTSTVQKAAVFDHASWADNGGEYELEMKPSLSGGLDDMHDKGRTEHRGQVVEGFSERFLEKLFTDSGAGFASAVVGSVVRNLILTLLGGLQETKKDVQGSAGILKNGAVGSFWDANFGHLFSGKSFAENTGMQTEMRSREIETNLCAGNGTIVRHTPALDLLCSDKCRSLIAECIRNFVSSAVSVYIEKTKDINYYDDMVAGITNPTHQAPMKELFVSVCNGAVETLVRTSHEVMFLQGSAEAELSSQQKHSTQVAKLEDIDREPFSVLDDMPFVSKIECQSTLQNGLHEVLSPLGSDRSHGRGGTLVEEGKTLTSFKDAHGSSTERSFLRLKSGKQQMQSWIEGVSKMLAIPSNRMLVMDVAGKMTSEAVRSSFEVMTSTISSCFRRKVVRGQPGFDAGANDIAENGKGQIQERTKAIMKAAGLKFFVLATICLALCLHYLLVFGFWNLIKSK